MDRVEDVEILKRYQAFMSGYVQRINASTFNVTIGGVRIGSAKYSRLAQINLKSRIITFSRFAVENVPERGRRYLVLHELAHVQEASHNKRFWDFVERFEPNYKDVGHSLELAFRKNVQDEHKNQAPLPATNLMNYKSVRELMETPVWSFTPNEHDRQSFECMEDEFDQWHSNPQGTIYGGSESEITTIEITHEN